ncbi:MAG: serine--tRNA ligase [Mycoplasmoidaceae bacterium]
MINLKLIRENPDILKNSLKKRNFNFDVDSLLKEDEKFRKINILLEQNNNKRNVLSKKIGEYIAQKNQDLANSTKKEVDALNKIISDQNNEINKIKDNLDNLLLSIPNILHSSIKPGKDENDNELFKKNNVLIPNDFIPKAHWDIGYEKNILDLETSSTLTGSRFSIYKGKGAKLVRALQSLTLDMHSASGYEEYILPLLLNEKSLSVTGQLPKFKDDLFQVDFRDYYLSPTLEVQLTNLFRNKILDQKELPIKVTSSSYNFRSEAGSAGKDIKGVLRQHQFIKTELVNICDPMNSYKALDEMVKQACSILDVLELPYRVMKLCSGDTGFGSAMTFDIEVWMPSYNNYREISSCSNCEDFQARRGQIRFANSENKKELVHTLNGTGLSIDRLWIAIVENYQNKDGDIIMPKALKKYLDFDKI